MMDIMMIVPGHRFPSIKETKALKLLTYYEKRRSMNHERIKQDGTHDVRARKNIDGTTNNMKANRYINRNEE